MNEKEILEELLDNLVKSYRSIGKKLPFYEDSNAKYTTLLNTQTKIFRSIVQCVSLLRNPRLQIGTSRGKADLAKMMKAVEIDGSDVEKTALMTIKDHRLRKRRLTIKKRF